ncbi:MAG: uroporphyrinogen-III C-methyltransferase [Gammaproteobacteria bacterium]|nr:uroporphyrinogen-III C-methyltransferase [Gammaproteobacteria bacterium]
MQRELGKVYLVGAGPGDPELLTLKAARLLGEADVVVYDRLVSAGVLALVPPGATRIFAGKSSGCHHMAQRELNDLLVRLAASRRRVVRLKGGDPFVFGRGGEEAQHLARHGIPFEIVPGITAALACSAYAGIPLTHRGLARSVHLVAGHCADGAPPRVDWRALAGPDSTLVLYMALANLEHFRAELIEAGIDPALPAAIIESGTTDAQRCLHTDLDGLAQSARDAGIEPPALVVLGRVTGLARELGWFTGQGQQDDGAAGRPEARSLAGSHA